MSRHNAKQMAGYAKSAARRRENNKPREVEEIRPILRDAAAVLKALARRTKRNDYRALYTLVQAMSRDLIVGELTRAEFDSWLARVLGYIEKDWPTPVPIDVESATAFDAVWDRATARHAKPEGE